MTTDPETQERGPVTFVHDFTVVEQPLSDLVQRLTSANSELWSWATRTGDDDRVMQLRASPGSSRLYVAKDVRVVVGSVRQTPGRAVVSIHWAATESPSLYPEMEADIEFVSLLPSTTEVTFMGSYRPPGGPIGRAIDTVLLRYVAESSVRCFLSTLTSDQVDPTNGSRSRDVDASQ